MVIRANGAELELVDSQIINYYISPGSAVSHHPPPTAAVTFTCDWFFKTFFLQFLNLPKPVRATIEKTS